MKNPLLALSIFLFILGCSRGGKKSSPPPAMPPSSGPMNPTSSNGDTNNGTSSGTITQEALDTCREDILASYITHIKPHVDNKCSHCHAEGGAAEIISFKPQDDDTNFRIFAQLLGGSPDAIYTKASGLVSHGGGKQLEEGDKAGIDSFFTSISQCEQTIASSVPAENSPLKLTQSTRRLSNQELKNTLKVLTGLEPTSLDLLPPESTNLSFDRIVESQTFSPAHLDAYFAIAREVAGRLVEENKMQGIGSMCPSNILPPAIDETTEEVLTASFEGTPAWAIVQNQDSPEQLHLSYAPDPIISYGYRFPAKGVYEIVLSATSVGLIHSAKFSLDGQQIAEQVDVSQNFQMVSTVSINEVRTHALAYSFSTEPDNHNLHMSFPSFTVRGPIDQSGQGHHSERLACAQSIIKEFAPKAYRRPLSTLEEGDLMALFQTSFDQNSYLSGLNVLVQSILISPHFLFLPEGTLDGQSTLTPFETAARLSYAICEEPPDEPLRAAAANGQLESQHDILAEVNRLFKKPCAEKTIERFFEQWLWLSKIKGTNKDPMLFPEFTESLKQSMLTESRTFLAELFWHQSAPLSSLFSANFSYANQELGTLYGIPGLTSFQRVENPPHRQGILSHASILSVTSSFEETSPVHRGYFVLKQILCSAPPPPPDNLAVSVPEVDPNMTTRDRWAAHSNDPACSSCHSALDPVGFAFEEFDSIGRFRTEENGHSIDASGGIPSLGVADGSLSGVAPMADVISEASRTKQCFAKQWLRYALGRLETAQDSATIDHLTNNLSSMSMKDALIQSFIHSSFLIK